MRDYFFISSPLHFLIAANVSIQNPAHDTTAVVIAKHRAAGGRFCAAARQFPDIFTRVLDLSGVPLRRFGAQVSCFKILKAELARPGAARLFTGNDRRMEFQYAIQIASGSDARVEGIYMDEGAVTYLGHKSMMRLAHRYIDPACKKLFYGFWYQNALTTGTSGWIKTAYVAFPALVHPLLKRKQIVAIDPAPFKTPPFKALACAMLEGHDDYPDLLRGIKLVLTLPHEGSYIGRPEIYREISRHLLNRFQPGEIAVKAHPRSTNQALLLQMFPGATRLDHHLGMEVLLPLLNQDCIVAGDVSSTLLTTRWLRPDLPVVAFMVHDAPAETLLRLFTALQIPMVAPARLAEWLARNPAAVSPVKPVGCQVPEQPR